MVVERAVAVAYDSIAFRFLRSLSLGNRGVNVVGHTWSVIFALQCIVQPNFPKGIPRWENDVQGKEYVLS